MEKAGAKRSVVGLVIPTGYSFNLDGTNIYMMPAALFIAQATNIHLSIGDQILLLLRCFPRRCRRITGAGFITLAATLSVWFCGACRRHGADPASPLHVGCR